MYERLKQGGNLFATTISVLVSALQKLSRSAKIPDGTLLYRGLSAMAMPVLFHKPDEFGSRGYAEWGFMSTTGNREIAILYSGVVQGKPKATVLVIRTGAVDRGACIQELSQYEIGRAHV